jgi:hypothetical protein
MTESATTQTGTSWPALPYEEWKDTYATLHLWTQIVGKIRLMRTPWLNHSWHVVLYVTTRGLTTSPIPDGERTFELTFDFISHELRAMMSDGRMDAVLLRPMPVAAFYQEVFAMLSGLGVSVRIHPMPNEIPDGVRLDQDKQHATYDPEQANRFWRALYQVDRVFKRFRTRFIGKSSPVHFFWGSFDLAVTRFSGRTAPKHPGGVPNIPDWVMQEAYSHEVASAGFWPGGDLYPEAVFYAYGYPEPPGYALASVRPEGAKFFDGMREFLLPYEIVRRSPDPDATLLEFLQSTYEAAANLAQWDRAALERPERLPKAP